MGGFDLGAHWMNAFAHRLNPMWLVDAALGGLRGPLEPGILVICAVWIALSLGTNRGSLRRAVDRPLAWSALAFLGVAYLGPDKYMNTIYAGSRFAPLAFSFALLAVPAPKLGGLVTRLLPIATATVFFSITALAWRAFDASELSGLRASLDAIRKPGMVLELDFAKGSELIKPAPFLQLVGYAEAEKGVVPNFSFAEHGSSIVAYTRRREIPWTRSLEWFAERVRHEDIAHFDYVLVVGNDDLQARFARFSGLVPLTRRGRCRLYAGG